MRTAVGDSVVAFARVIGTVSGDAADLLIRRDLAEQIGQNRCVADMVSCDFNGSDFQRFLVDPKVDLAPAPPFGAPCLRACHSPSPSTLIQVLSAARQGIAQ